MSSANPLSTGSISQIYNDETGLKPTLQIIDVKQITRNDLNQATRFRLILSDSVLYQQALLSSQLSELCFKGKIKKYTIIRLNEYLINMVQNSKVIIILNLDIVGPGEGEIGQPKSVYKEAGKSSSSPSAGSAGSRPNPHASAGSGRNYGQSSGKGFAGRPNYNQAQQRGGSGGSGGSRGRGGYGGSSNYNLPRNSMNDARVVPVASLNPYRNSWVIKVRCVTKGDIRHWNNERSSGKLMSVDLIDKDQCEIRCTMFKDAVDKFDPVFELDKVYYISKGKIKVSNKKWTHIPHDYEITLDTNSVVEVVHGDDPSIKGASFDFKPIGSIENLTENSFVDIVGIVKSVDELRQIESQKTNRVITKRSITLQDNTGAIELTLWSKNAEDYNEEKLADFPVLAVKAARVSTFGGKSLSTSSSSVLAITPDLPEANELKGWWDSGGSEDQGIKSLTVAFGGQRKILPTDRRFTFKEMKEQDLGRQGKADFFVVKGTITSIKHDVDKTPWYLACPRQRNSKQCNKKLIEENGSYRCVECNAVGPEFEARYILGFAVQDFTGSHYVNSFDDIGQELLGVSAQELDQQLKQGDEAAFNRTFNAANFRRMHFKVRAKMDNYQDTERLKLNVIGMEDVNYDEESKKLIDQIKALG